MLAAVGTGALATPDRASAKTPCWLELVRDWSDGQIEKIYAPHCYREAIKKLPPDVDFYSNAREDIARALQAALVGKLPPPNKPPSGGSRGGPDLGTETPITKALETLGPSNADSAPIPLLILGGLALLLMAAGGAGVVARKIQARREGPSPQ